MNGNGKADACIHCTQGFQFTLSEPSLLLEPYAIPRSWDSLPMVFLIPFLGG